MRVKVGGIKRLFDAFIKLYKNSNPYSIFKIMPKKGKSNIINKDFCCILKREKNKAKKDCQY